MSAPAAPKIAVTLIPNSHFLKEFNGRNFFQFSFLKKTWYRVSRLLQRCLSSNSFQKTLRNFKLINNIFSPTLNGVLF